MLIAGVVIYLVIGFFKAMSAFSRLPAERSLLASTQPLLYVIITTIFWPILLLARIPNFVHSTVSEADENLFKAATADPTGFISKALKLRGKKRLAEALVLLDKTIFLDPKSSRAIQIKGNILREMGRTDEALQCFDSVLAFSPDDLGAWSNKASILQEMKRFTEALEIYDILLKNDPRSASDLKCKAETFLLMGQRYEEALKCIEDSISIYNNDRHAWADKGIILQRLGRHDEAAICFATAGISIPQSTY